jgi:hypothetical protein
MKVADIHERTHTKDHIKKSKFVRVRTLFLLCDAVWRRSRRRWLGYWLGWIGEMLRIIYRQNIFLDDFWRKRSVSPTCSVEVAFDQTPC